MEEVAFAAVWALVLGLEPSTFLMLGKHPTAELYALSLFNPEKIKITNLACHTVKLFRQQQRRRNKHNCLLILILRVEPAAHVACC